MKTLVIQLDRLEDTGSIRDKVTWGKSSRVLLVWPVNYIVLDRKIDLVTIKRICTSQGSRLGIVCDEPVVIDEAEELQIPVFSSVNQAMRKGWDRRKQKKGVISPLDLSEHWQDVEDIRQRIGLVSTAKDLSKPMRLVLMSSAIIAVILLALFIIPSAEVRIYPMGQPREMNVEFQVLSQETGTSSPDILGGEIVKITVEAQAERQTTGFVPVPDAKAKGSITINNQTDKEITIPAHTIVMDKANPPVRYQITQDTTLAPEMASSGIPIEAIYGGEEGNAEPGTITRIDGEFGLQLDLVNPEPVVGGTDRKIPAPSSDDLIALRGDLKTRLAETAEKQLASQLKDEEVLLTSSIESGILQSETVTPEVGQAGSKVSMTQKIEFSALVVNQKDLTEKAQAILMANLVLPGWMVSTTEPVGVEILSQSYDNLTNSARVNTLVKGKTIPIVDTNHIRQAIVGRNRNDVEKLIAGMVLSEKGIEINSWPVNLPILPFLEIADYRSLPHEYSTWHRPR